MNKELVNAGMKLIDVLVLSGKGLNERKFRLALNLIGIAVGCLAITALISLTQGLSDNVTGQLQIFGPDQLIIAPGQVQSGQIVASSSFTWKDVNLIKKMGQVEIATPTVANKLSSYNIKGKTYYAETAGFEYLWFRIIENAKPEEGRLLQSGDVATCVVGRDLAFSSDGEKPIIRVGDRIKIEAYVDGENKELNVRVVGILAKTGGVISENFDSMLILPIRTAEKFFDVGGEFTSIFIKAKSTEDVPIVKEEITKIYGDDVTIVTSVTIQELVTSIISAIQAVLSGIAGISLLVAGVGIINTMTISVIERTHEIGILKAIGSRNRDVLFLFLSEAAITGLIGGLLGAALGIALAVSVGGFIDLSVSISPMLVVYVAGFAVTTSILAGFYPALKASKLNPIEALRQE